MFALPRLSERVPAAPPTNDPIVPEYESDAPIVGVDVAVVLSVPVPPAVYTSPFEVRLESVEIDCVLFTLNALPEYVRPVPAVVVAPDETSPPYTASPPLESDESRNGPEKVDDAVENIPPVNPSTDEVELPYDCEVNGNTCPASVEVDTVDTTPLDPMYE